MKASTAASASQKGAQPAAAQKHGKKGKGHKAQTKEVVLRDGFLLEDVSSQSLLGPRGLHPYSSKLFSVPLGSLLTSNPLAVEGLFSHLVPLVKSNQGLVRQDPRTTIRMFDDEVPVDVLAAAAAEEYASVLKKAEEGHREKSNELLEVFIELIQKSFELDAKASTAQVQGLRPQRGCGAEYQPVLIQTLVKLAHQS